MSGLQGRCWHAVCHSNFIFKFKLYQGLPVIEKAQKLECVLLLAHIITLREKKKMQSKGNCGKALLNLGKYYECMNTQFITIWFWDSNCYWEDGIWASCLAFRQFWSRAKICINRSFIRSGHSQQIVLCAWRGSLVGRCGDYHT